jgi:hypothetical protein
MAMVLLENRPMRMMRMREGTAKSLATWGLSIMLAVLASSPCLAGNMTALLGGSLLQASPLFPPDNWWNLDISSWPLDPNSAAYISFINNGGTRRLHPDLGGNAPTSDDPSASCGIPYAVVSNVTAADLVAVQFDSSDESDGVNHVTGNSYPFYPIPREVITQPYWIEGGDPGNVDLRDSQDRHLLIVDADQNYLYELYNVYYDGTQGQWFAGSGAFFDMNKNDRRPETWTSADAAGLAILPGLIRYDEVYNPAPAEIGHAFRVTVRSTDGYVYPASHRAGSTAGALPMGARLRLKASVDVSQRTKDPQMQRLFRAFQKHGLIVADNGSDMFITGTYDLRWDSDILNPAFRALSASDFEVVQLGYNPPAPAPSVHNLHASRSGNSLVLLWDQLSGGAQFQIESTAQLGPASVWQVRGQTAQASWSEALSKTAPMQFYRVVTVIQ